MSTTHSSWTRERAKIASLTRSRAADDPELIEARRNMRALRMEEWIEKQLAESPPLTDDQLQRLSALLSRGEGSAA